MRKLLIFPLLLAWCGLALSAAPVEGRDYTLVNPPKQTGDPSRIVVTEYFSYYCSHCANFAPYFDAWKKSLPADVHVERLPISLGRASWVPVARTFLALQAMNSVERVDAALFTAINHQGVRMDSEAAITAWLVGRGIDGKAFAAMYRSFGVDTQQRNAETRAREAGVGSTPSLVIDGRYMMVIGDAGEQRAQHYRAQLAVANELISRARQQRRQ